ncbi:MAG: CehA/McbA family metallohydrolase [Planctomycetota bacterium]|nr:CehA/McbA family metallohydrolase [Planctomycetota bacterium]
MKKNACILLLLCGPLAAAGLYLLFPPAVSGAAQAKGAKVLSDEVFHLGNDEKKDWKAFTRAKPHDGKKITVRFSAEPNKSENALELRSGDVNSKCGVTLNSRRLGSLVKGKGGKGENVQYFKVPAGLLKKTGNTLVVAYEEKTTDDLYIGPFVLHSRSVAALQRLAEVEVFVTSKEQPGKGLPCRLSIVRLVTKRAKIVEEPVEVKVDKSAKRAIRKGTVYTLDGRLSLALKAGKYRIYATRGFEYGLGKARIDVSPAEKRRVELVLEREVDTTGYLAGDTHIHTLTYSGHGDASVAERVVTIAGEGVEVAIATDHNHHTDYSSWTSKAGSGSHYKSVVGNEFTTSIGHFNAFPVEKKAKPANHKHSDWDKLLKAVRATPGVRVVICNHPRRQGFKKGPWGKIGMDPVSGEFSDGRQWLGLDAVEVINGKTLEKDPYDNFSDWFALLNAGHRLTAVAGSDSHTVAQPVGHCRTYIRSSTDDPGKINVAEVVENVLAGRVLVSMGLLADVKVNGKFTAGDLATGVGEDLEVEVEVRGPRWTRASRVALFFNGRKVREEKIAHSSDAVVKYKDRWVFGGPSTDIHLVLVATGPPLENSYWSPPQDDRYVIGATNPVWIDGDGDGKYSAPGDYARALVAECGTDGVALAKALRVHDEITAILAAGLFRRKLETILADVYSRLQKRSNSEFEDFIESCKAIRGDAFKDYAKGLGPLDLLKKPSPAAAEKKKK